MLNYRQLYYFWTVAKSGGIARAAERLHLTPQTISGQIGELERSLETPLFTRAGRRIELTPAGRRALSQAEEIFHLGEELEASLRNPTAGGERVFRVGIADVIAKSLAHQLLAPVVTLPEPVRLICHEDKLERLFAELSLHHLDLVIADRRLPPEVGVKAYSHVLGRCATEFLSAPKLASQYREGFPQSLDGAPLLMPGQGAALRGALERWFADLRISPRIVGEFDDTALMAAFGHGGVGVFPTAAVPALDVSQRQGVVSLGRTDAVIVKYYAITMERRITHPAVAAIMQSAKVGVFQRD